MVTERSTQATMVDVFQKQMFRVKKSYYWTDIFFSPSLPMSLGLSDDFGSIAKMVVGGFLALKSHIICSSKKSCMKTNVDIVCFSIKSVFLIDPKK